MLWEWFEPLIEFHAFMQILPCLFWNACQALTQTHSDVDGVLLNRMEYGSVVRYEYLVLCFNGLLYVLAGADPRDSLLRGFARHAQLTWLWSYNHVEDAWKEVGEVISPDAHKS